MTDVKGDRLPAVEPHLPMLMGLVFARYATGSPSTRRICGPRSCGCSSGCRRRA